MFVSPLKSHFANQWPGRPLNFFPATKFYQHRMWEATNARGQVYETIKNILCAAYKLYRTLSWWRSWYYFFRFKHRPGPLRKKNSAQCSVPEFRIAKMHIILTACLEPEWSPPPKGNFARHPNFRIRPMCFTTLHEQLTESSAAMRRRSRELSRLLARQRVLTR